MTSGCYNTRDKDEEVIKVVEEMKKAGVKTLKDEKWQIEEGLVLKEGKVYVPKDEKLRVEIIWLHHDTPIAGHGGQWKTVVLWQPLDTKSNDHTTSKSQSWISSGEFTRELNKESLLN